MVRREFFVNGLDLECVKQHLEDGLKDLTAGQEWYKHKFLLHLRRELFNNEGKPSNVFYELTEKYSGNTLGNFFESLNDVYPRYFSQKPQAFMNFLERLSEDCFSFGKNSPEFLYTYYDKNLSERLKVFGK